MQVACDAPPLKFLARHEPAEQVDPLCFGRGPLLDLLQERGVALSKLAGPLCDPHLEFIVRLLQQLGLAFLLVRSPAIFA